MNSRKTLVIGALCLVLVLTVCPPGAHSGVLTKYLDGAWFKLKLTVKGHKHDPSTGAVQTYNFQAPAYLHFTWDPISNDYETALWTQQDGVWALSDWHYDNTIHPGENFINLRLLFNFTNGDYIQTHHTPFINIQMSGALLKKATWDGTGEVMKGLFEGNTKCYYGYFNLKGTTVDPSKLPPGITP